MMTTMTTNAFDTFDSFSSNIMTKVRGFPAINFCSRSSGYASGNEMNCVNRSVFKPEIGGGGNYPERKYSHILHKYVVDRSARRER